MKFCLFYENGFACFARELELVWNQQEAMIQIKHILELCLKIYFFLNTFFEKRNEDSMIFITILMHI